MYLPCPNPGCEGSVELGSEEVDSGDGPWLQSGVAYSMVWDTTDEAAPRCEAGCGLTPAQVEALEARAAEEYALGPTEPW